MNNKKEPLTSMFMLMKKDRSCRAFGDFSLCSIDDCYKCDNCDYAITNKNGIVTKYFSKRINSDFEKYIIQFFDEVDFDDIDSYLSNPKSDYRIISETGSILRKSSTDIPDKSDDCDFFQLFYEEFIKKSEPKRIRKYEDYKD